MSSNKGSMVLLTVIAVATLLVAVAGATFSYFSATLGSESNTTIEVTSGTLSVEYDGNSNISGTATSIGETIASKDFQITGVVTGSTNLNYEGILSINSNPFSEGTLVYTITSYNESSNGTIISSTTDPVVIPAGTSTVSLGYGTFAGPVSTGATHKYTINIMMVDNGVDSGSYLGQTFSGQLSVVQSTK